MAASPNAGRGEQRFCQLPQFLAHFRVFRIAFDGEEAAQHADHIAIEHGRIHVKGEAGDGARRVTSDAGQGHQSLDGARPLAVPFVDDDLRRLVQIARSSVIAESFPQLQHIAQRRGSEIVNRRETLEKAVEVRNHRLDLRLLQHHLAEPHAIRRSIVPPGQIACIGAKPVKQSRVDFGFPILDFGLGDQTPLPPALFVHPASHLRRVILQNERIGEGHMEIEAKFAVPDEATWLKLQTVEQIAGYALSPGKTKQVHDTFVDTPDRAILASGHVCRKREVDGQIVMTLKSGQTVEGAVHRREELEVTLERELPIGQWPPERDPRSAVGNRRRRSARPVVRSASNAHHPLGLTCRSGGGGNERGQGRVCRSTAESRVTSKWSLN